VVRQQCRLRAWGESQVRDRPRRTPRAHPELTRQNRNGNVERRRADFCSPRGEEVRAHSLKSRQGVPQDRKRAPDCRESRTSSKEPIRVNGAERRKVVRALSGSKRRTEILCLVIAQLTYCLPTTRQLCSPSVLC
jgi:hypothetical protein